MKNFLEWCKEQNLPLPLTEAGPSGERTCLKCQEKFISDGNFTCKKCQKSNQGKRSGASSSGGRAAHQRAAMGKVASEE